MKYKGTGFLLGSPNKRYMPVTAASLKLFYQTPLGCALARDISAGLSRCRLPRADEMAVGFGYTAPYWSRFTAGTHHSLSFLPAQIAGQETEPASDAEDNNKLGEKRESVILGEEHRFPLADNSADCILAIHALEFCPDARAQMRELWRILAPNGRLILAAPNRRGLWARAEQMPFGHGQPYSRRQMAELLNENKFAFSDIYEIGHFLPDERYRLTLRSRLYSKFAGHFIPYFGAILLTEARKQLYRPAGRQNPAARSIFFPGFTSPQPVARVKSGNKPHSL